MRFKSDAIDECCLELMGHDNWAYMYTLKPADRRKLSDDDTVVVFYAEPSKEVGDEK